MQSYNWVSQYIHNIIRIQIQIHACNTINNSPDKPRQPNTASITVWSGKSVMIILIFWWGVLFDIVCGVLLSHWSVRSTLCGVLLCYKKYKNTRTCIKKIHLSPVGLLFKIKNTTSIRLRARLSVLVLPINTKWFGYIHTVYSNSTVVNKTVSIRWYQYICNDLPTKYSEGMNIMSNKH